MSQQSFKPLREHVELKNRLRRSRIDVYNAQFHTSHPVEIYEWSQQAERSKQELIKKGLDSFTKNYEVPSQHRFNTRLRQRPQISSSLADYLPKVKRPPTLEELLTLNKANLKHKKHIPRLLISVKPFSLKNLEPLEHSRNMTALRPVQSFNRLKAAQPTLLIAKEPENCSFSFLKVDSFSPSKLNLDDVKSSTMRSQSHLEVTPRSFK